MVLGQRLANMRLEDAQASVQSDKDMIDSLIQSYEGGFPAVNAFVKEKIREALCKSRERFEAEFDSLEQLLSKDIAEKRFVNAIPSQPNRTIDAVNQIPVEDLLEHDDHSEDGS